jgi:hypothetical protein
MPTSRCSGNIREASLRRIVIAAAREAKYYRIGSDEALEQIYDENAARP